MVVVHTCGPNTREAHGGARGSLRTAWATQCDPTSTITTTKQPYLNNNNNNSVITIVLGIVIITITKQLLWQQCWVWPYVSNPTTWEAEADIRSSVSSLDTQGVQSNRGLYKTPTEMTTLMIMITTDAYFKLAHNK